MTTPKLKTLLRVSSEIINMFLENEDVTNHSFIISPFYDESQKGTEMVSIVINNIWELEYNFLEPVAKKLSDTQIRWTINRDENKFSINLYY